MRRALIGGLLAAAAVVPAATAAALPPPAPEPIAVERSVERVALVPAPPALPTAAVAIGDSFISGEGAGAYQPVVDLNGVAQGFPGWAAPNTNAFFCHRSANASLLVAPLTGIDARFNLA